MDQCYGCQSCSSSAEQGKLMYPYPRLRLRIWSRETGSPILSRVSSLILQTQAESGACSRAPLFFTMEPVSRNQILRHARGQGNIYFPCSTDHEQDWQPYPVDPYSAMCDDHTYIHTVNHYLVYPEFIRSRNCVPMTFTAGSSPAQGQWSSR